MSALRRAYEPSVALFFSFSLFTIGRLWLVRPPARSLEAEAASSLAEAADVFPRANQRPCGPCRNAEISVRESCTGASALTVMKRPLLLKISASD